MIVLPERKKKNRRKKERSLKEGMKNTIERKTEGNSKQKKRKETET